MKYFICLLFLFPLFANAQRTVTLDTTYQTNADGKFFDVRRVEYTSGESSLTKTLIGDTTTIYNNYRLEFLRRGEQMANDARAARRFDKDITDIINKNDLAASVTGRNILDTLVKQFSGPLLASGWQITDGTNTTDISFQVNANGKLRYTIAAQTKTAVLINNTMRLLNYLNTGQPIDVFKSAGGNWFTIDDRIKIKFPGNQGQNQAPPKSPILIKPVPLTQPTKATQKTKKKKQ